MRKGRDDTIKATLIEDAVKKVQKQVIQNCIHGAPSPETGKGSRRGKQFAPDNVREIIQTRIGKRTKGGKCSRLHPILQQRPLS